ncbi:MAG: lyase [Pseudomonadota bacterium]
MEAYLPESDFLCSILNEEVSFESDFGARNLALLITMLDDPIDANRDWATFFLATSDHDSPAIRAALLKAAKDPHFDTRCEALSGLAQRNVEGVEALVLEALNGDHIGELMFEAAQYVAKAELVPALEEIKLFWDDDNSALNFAIECCKTGISARY